MTQRTLLEIADAVRSIARSGLFYTKNFHDRERYERLLRLAIRLATLHEPAEWTRIEQIFAAEDLGYATPKVDVRMAIFQEDRVLLVRELTDDRWALPGGYADIGDSPSEAAVRETREEAGLEVRARKLVGVFDSHVNPCAHPTLFQVYKLVFLGELVDPTARPQPGSETSAAGFHETYALPELSLGRTAPFHIEQAQQARTDPAWSPHFD